MGLRVLQAMTLRDDADARQDEHVHLGMREEPEQDAARESDCHRRRIGAAAPLKSMRVHHESRRHEEARAEYAVEEVHDRRGFERREGEQQQVRGDELRPARKTECRLHVMPRRAELDEGGDEIDRAEQRSR